MSICYLCRKRNTAFVIALSISLIAPVATSIGQVEPSYFDGEPFALEREIRVQDGHLQWVAFNPSGNRVAACGDSMIQMFDMETGGLVRQFKGHSQDIFRFAFSPDGEFVASGSRDQTIRVWHVASGEQVAILEGHTDRIIGVNFSHDSRWLASASANHDGSIRVWSCDDWKQVAVAHAPRNTNAMFLAFSPDAQWLATSEYRGGVRLYQFDGESLALHKEMSHEGGEMTPHVVFAPDGESMVTSGWDRYLRCWNVATGEQVWSAKTPPYARCFEASVFSPNGDAIYSVTRDETIQVRDSQSGELRDSFRWHDAGIRGLGINKQGTHLATGGHDGKIRLWRIKESEAR